MESSNCSKVEDYKIKIYRPGEAGLDHVFAIRKQVFTIEQGIPAIYDRDDKDDLSYHLLLSYKDHPVATGRLFIRDTIGHLARIAVLPRFRGKNLGGKVVLSLEEVGKSTGLTSFELFPHSFLLNFYLRLGYNRDPDYELEVAGYKLYRMYKII